MTFNNLVNMRCEYNFRYISYSGPSWFPETSQWIQAESNNVTFINGPYEPLQGHIALTEKIDEMRVMWVSDVPLHENSIVEYGVQSGRYSFTSHGSSHTYFADEMCGFPATRVNQVYFRSPGTIHDVLLKKLKPETTYYYRYGNPEYGWSKEASFVTSPEDGSSEVNFVFYGDMWIDVAPGAQETVKRVLTDYNSGISYSFILHAGDHSYAEGFEWIWEYFFMNLQPIATKIPYMISIGNHEYDHVTGGKNDPSGAKGEGFHPSWGNFADDSGGECAVPMFHRFHMPDNGHGIFWYSFNSGNVHVIMLSTEHDWQIGSTQYNWLLADLQSVNRTTYPWIVLTGHRPMYTSETSNSPQDFAIAAHLRTNIEPLLDEYKVNLCLWGHVHSYERTCPVLNETCVDEGPVHAVVGTAGVALDWGATFGAPWSVSTAMEYGYSRISTTETEMHFQFVLNTNGTIYDDFYIPLWI